MLEGIAFYKDQWIEASSLYMHISDLSIHRAYAVFDYMKEQQGTVPFIQDYLDRFQRSLHLSGISIPYNKEELHALVLEMIRKNSFGLSGIKLLATGGYSPNGFTVPDQSNFYILNYKGKKIDPQVFRDGITLIQDEFQRPNPEIKTTQYFNTATLHKKMMKYGAEDVLYHYHDRITETSRANFYVIKDGIIKTSGGKVLLGITRKNFLQRFTGKYTIELNDLVFSDLEEVDEAFITSTSRGVVPVIRIEDILIGDGKIGPLTKRLMSEFNDS